MYPITFCLGTVEGRAPPERDISPGRAGPSKELSPGHRPRHPDTGPVTRTPAPITRTPAPITSFCSKSDGVLLQNKLLLQK